jgi:hypothetical protein
MNLDRIRELARDERLYPSLILYGASLDERQRAAVEIARTLLCDEAPADRPCDAADPDRRCRHCRRVEWPGPKMERFHPDLHVLERDLRTSTSVAATKGFLSTAYEAPFEARGQVFVIAEAESLTGGAADALLKLLEEPPTRSPRHFLLLAASRLDLLPTLRSRSLAVFLGGPEGIDEAAVAELADAFRHAVGGYLATSSAVYLLTAAEALAGAEGWRDPRARKPWATAAAAVLRYLEVGDPGPAVRRALLAFAEELLDGPWMRVRGVTHGRILEGLLCRHLAGRA